MDPCSGPSPPRSGDHQVRTELGRRKENCAIFISDQWGCSGKESPIFLLLLLPLFSAHRNWLTTQQEKTQNIAASKPSVHKKHNDWIPTLPTHPQIPKVYWQHLVLKKYIGAFSETELKPCKHFSWIRVYHFFSLSNICWKIVKKWKLSQCWAVFSVSPGCSCWTFW